MAVSAVTGASAGAGAGAGAEARPASWFRAIARWERRYRRERDAAFATVPHYRDLWSATALGEPTPIEVAQARIPELFPLRANRPDTAPLSRHGLRQALRVAGVRSPSEPSEVHDVCRSLPSDAGPGAMLHHPLLGYPAALGDCGHWHVVHRCFFVRALPDARLLAFTALDAPGARLIDITLGPLAPARLGVCPRHGTPTVTA